MIMEMLQWGRASISAERRLDITWGTYTDMLQWGRASISAESTLRLSDPGGPLSGFNGAALRLARKEDQDVELLLRILELQWGRASISAERLMHLIDEMKAVLASMGPRFD